MVPISWKIKALEEELTVFTTKDCRPQFGQIPFIENAEYGRVTQHIHYHSQFTANLQIYTNTSQQDPHSAFLPYQIAVANCISETGLSSPVIHSIKKISKPGISKLFLKRSESKSFQAVGQQGLCTNYSALLYQLAAVSRKQLQVIHKQTSEAVFP